MNNNDYIEIKNILKRAVDELIDLLEKVVKEGMKPDKRTAIAILEFIAMDEGMFKENMKILCGKELSGYKLWLDNFCEKI